MPTPYSLAKSVNHEVNESTSYRSDLSLYQRAEHWEPAAGEGDCEDYALAKRAALLKAGADLDDLRLATCWCEDGGYHAVLVVTTDEGEFVLDNRYQDPMPRQLLPYKWDKIQKGHQWFAIA